MPFVKDKKGNSHYSMSPAKAKKKAADADQEPAAPGGAVDDDDSGPLRSMEVEPGENGVAVTSRHEPPKSKGKNNDIGYSEPKKHFFADGDAAAAHVKAKLAKHFGRK